MLVGDFILPVITSFSPWVVDGLGGAAIATAIAGGDREAMLAAAEAAIPEAEAAPLREALASARAGEGAADFTQMQGWVLIAFQDPFGHLAIGTSIEDALIQTVGAGGDTDTNGAICGALLGAAQGRAAIPDRWNLAMQACRPMAVLGAVRSRPARYWPDYLTLLAEGLLVRASRDTGGETLGDAEAGFDLSQRHNAAV